MKTNFEVTVKTSKVTNIGDAQ